MGACQFSVQSSGKTASEAFKRAVDEARYDHGHGGYSGTIAEKNDFKTVSVPNGTDPLGHASKCIDDENHFSDDKWGPAACVLLGPCEQVPGENNYVFFGWASS